MIKFFEIRDRMTNISAVGIRLNGLHTQRNNSGATLAEEKHATGIIRRAGFALDKTVILISLKRLSVFINPSDWNDPICMTPAHKHIVENWASLPFASVVDTEFLRGERDAPRKVESL